MPPAHLESLLARLRNVRASGKGWTARCPAHEDSRNSLSVRIGDDGRILVKCFAGCTFKQVVRALELKVRDLFPGTSSRHGRAAPITVEQLARAKGLPTEFLRSLGVEQRPGGVVIPYRLRDGSPAPRHRLRTALCAGEGSRWLSGCGKPVPYGLDRLEAARRAAYLVLAEGESDCWTLWSQGFPALGVPGARMAHTLQASYFERIRKVYVIQEAGAGGEAFVRGVAERLSNLGFRGQAFVVKLPGGADPNDLLRQAPERFKQAFQEALELASPLQLQKSGSLPRVSGEPQRILEQCGLLRLTRGASMAEAESALRELARLSNGLDPLGRQLVRVMAIQHLASLGFRSPAAVVDAALQPQTRQCTTRGPGLVLREPEPSPEPVDGARLLEELRRAICRFVVLPPHGDVAIALWVVLAYCIDAVSVAPILAITSPVKRCGKTLLLGILHALVPRPLAASNMTLAAVFRTIEHYRPTLLIDEADTFLGVNRELRGVLNSGHTRATAAVVRVVGDEHEPRLFSTWCAKVIAAIGRLPETLCDRSIEIPMKRKTRAEQVERLRQDRLDTELAELRARAARWAVDHRDALREADPEVPDGLNDRAQDNWRPLLAIADLAGGDWPERARRAATVLSGGAADDEGSLGVELLRDLRDLFEGRGERQLSSEDIVRALNSREDRPWPELGKGRGLTKPQLARLLRPFGIGPRTIRTGDKTPKGYRQVDCDDAFARYLAAEPQHPQQSRNDAETGPPPKRNAAQAVADAPGAERGRNGAVVAVVADESRLGPEKRGSAERDLFEL